MQERFRDLGDGTAMCITCGTKVSAETTATSSQPCPKCAEVEQLETVRNPPFSPDELHPE